MRVNWSGFLFTAAWTSQLKSLGVVAQVAISNLQVVPSLDQRPRFSWTLSTSVSEFDVIQTSYHILVSRYQAGADDVWNSGTVSSRQRRLRYSGSPLSPDTHYYWSIELETTAGSANASSNFTTEALPHPLIEIRQDSDALARIFTTASWIWTSEANSPNAPGEDRAFRRTYTPPSGKSAVAADMLITVDNRYSLFANGKLVGSSSASSDEFGWKSAQRYHVALDSGANVFAIHAFNARDINTGAESPAGLLLAIQVTHSDGSTVMLWSNDNWRASKVIPANFERPSLDDSSWGAAVVLGQYGMSPWSTEVNVPAVATPPNPPASTSTPSTPPASDTLQPPPQSSTSAPQSSGAPTSNSPDTQPGSISASTTLATTLGANTGSSSLSTDPPGTTLPSGGQSDSDGPNPEQSQTGPIVGGVIGGVVILILLAILVLCRKGLFRRRSPRLEDSYEPAAAELSQEELVVQPFTLIPSEDTSSTFRSPTGQHKPGSYLMSDYGARAGAGAIGHPGSSGAGTELDSYYQDGGSSAGFESAEGSSTMRMQRLQELVSELNREIAEGAEEMPYAAELRGRIAELTREDSEHVGAGMPPPYPDKDKW
ncbi:hypothetical protein D9615_006949 [Tricholomella constricta]|uniref:Uncharacterized protein n=1 Tax=Tricholomella constricta TaxID=117010 RepID=A0A8H5M2H2_9AGAR|nr:hypothetical protein D9615_006949 [Tricholomella constricta]